MGTLQFLKTFLSMLRYLKINFKYRVAAGWHQASHEAPAEQLSQILTFQHWSNFYKIRELLLTQFFI
jgi:hypothetical protein